MYRTIESSFWSDPKVRSLSPPAKLLFLYLITNDRSHVSGIYYLPRASISHETGYPINTLSRVVQELIASKTIAVDEERDVFWVKKMFRYQGRGTKNNASATKQLASLHNSPLIKEFCNLYPAVKLPSKYTLSDTLSEVGRDCSQEQEQEQEQEQKKDKEQKKAARAVPCFAIEIGSILDTPEFQAAWTDWLSHRREIKHALTPTQAAKQLVQFEQWGVARSVAAIEHTITKGWQGIREPDAPVNGKAAAKPLTVADIFGDDA